MRTGLTCERAHRRIANTESVRVRAWPLAANEGRAVTDALAVRVDVASGLVSGFTECMNGRWQPMNTLSGHNHTFVEPARGSLGLVSWIKQSISDS